MVQHFEAVGTTFFKWEPICQGPGTCHMVTWYLSYA